MSKDFWSDSIVTVMGGGSWGTVLAHLASQNCREVRVWLRDEAQARAINSTRKNPNYAQELVLSDRVHAFTDLSRALATEEGGIQAVIWALPSAVTREQAKLLAPKLKGHEILLHASKGVEDGSLKRLSEVLAEELPIARIGVISGPNLAGEIARNEPAATVVASQYQEVIAAGQDILTGPRFRVYSVSDVIGVEWAGTLKNILAIASGALDALGFGWNARAMLITRGLAEMVRFGSALGACQETFLGLAGMGDLLATCSSPLSRNYRVGRALAEGKKIDEILGSLGAVAEGVRTARAVHEFAKRCSIDMPITEGVYALVEGKASVQEVLQSLMVRPRVKESS